MALTPEEVKRMEEQADLSDRFNKAADRYVAGNNPGLRAAEREQVLRGREADVFSAARQRRLDSQRMTAIADPGRYAPSVRQEALEWQRNGGLRAHELAMLNKQGENDFRIAEQKRLGMREQGANAAGLNAEATKYGWDKQLEMEQERQKGGLTLAEKQIASQERIAGMEHGTIGEDGTVTPGSRERVTRITKEAEAQQAEKERQFQLEKQKLVNEGNAAVATTRGEASVAAAQARGDQAQANRIKRFDEMAAQGKFAMAGITAVKWVKMSEEEKARVRNQIMGSMDELNANPQQQPKKKGLSDYEVK